MKTEVLQTCPYIYYLLIVGGYNTLVMGTSNTTGSFVLPVLIDALFAIQELDAIS